MGSIMPVAIRDHAASDRRNTSLSSAAVSFSNSPLLHAPLELSIMGEGFDDAHRGPSFSSAAGQAAGFPGWSWVEQWMPPPPEAIVSIATGTTSRLGKCSCRIPRALSSALRSPNLGMKTASLAM